jgi:hypothetical protein
MRSLFMMQQGTRKLSLETPIITGWLNIIFPSLISIIAIRLFGSVDLDHLHEKSHLLKLRSAAMAFGGPPSWENDGQRELENPAVRWRLGRIVMRVCAQNICMLCIEVSVYLYLLNHICTVWTREKCQLAIISSNKRRKKSSIVCGSIQGGGSQYHQLVQQNLGLSENSVPLHPMVLLIIIPIFYGYFIGNIPYIFRQTHLNQHFSVRVSG